MGGVFAVFVAFVALGIGIEFGCSFIPSEGRAISAAENLGMQDARVISRSPAWGALGGCKDDDVTKFTVVGTTNGQQRQIEVCAPLIGGYTVRS